MLDARLEKKQESVFPNRGKCREGWKKKLSSFKRKRGGGAGGEEMKKKRAINYSLTGTSLL